MLCVLFLTCVLEQTNGYGLQQMAPAAAAGYNANMQTMANMQMYGAQPGAGMNVGQMPATH